MDHTLTLASLAPAIPEIWLAAAACVVLLVEAFAGAAARRIVPTLTLALIACALMGSMSTALLSVGNTTVQLATDPDTRGQVMSLWSMALLGTTVVGGPLVGWIGEHFGARYSIAAGGLSAIGAGLAGLAALRRLDIRQPVVIA